MSENENENEQYLDEEYHFADEPELGESETVEAATTPASTSSSSQKSAPNFEAKIKDAQDFFKRNSPARNALVAVGIIIVLLLLYKFTSSLFSGNKDNVHITKAVQNQQMTPAVTVTPTPIMVMPNTASSNSDVKNKLSALEQSQTNMQSQFATINNQISSLNTNLNSLVDKVNQVTLQVAQLSATVQNQSHLILMLTEQAKPKPKLIKRVISNPIPVLKYYVQAVIPGRAWLIATNGSTLTVREGTILPGYGVVKLIDAIQGQVLTSSGQVIRFSQDDS